MKSFRQAFDALTGLTNYETMVRPPYSSRDMNLERTRALLGRVGSPERNFPTLQVAGTKGKGTTATALAAMLTAGGYRAGLYTSPHLFHVRERLRVDGEWIGEREFTEGVATLLPHVEPLRGTPECPTFFELVTVLALLHFARREVDVAVLEVGLGGRLDATSAVPHLASLITQIGLDHTAILGGTLTAIAAEKAGVARRGVPLVSGVPLSTPPGRVIDEAARKNGAPVFFPGRDFRIVAGSPRLREGAAATPVHVVTVTGRRLALRPAVLGRALARDVGLAAILLSVPGVARRLPVTEDAVEKGATAFSIPGRLQVIPGSPPILVDGAHNPDSARVLVRTITEVFPERPVVAILGGGIDKGIPSIAGLLSRLDRPVRFVFTRPATHPRAADPTGLADGRRDAIVRAGFPEALSAARRRAGPEDLIVVSGSLYLAGEALLHLEAVTPPR